MSLSPSNLRNRNTFPPFSSLPHPYDLPRNHWCFLGEIISYDFYSRLCLDVRDTSGKVLKVAFYTSDSGASVRAQARVGSTVAILYAEQYQFLDGHLGFRIETMEHLKIVPCSLNELLAANDIVFGEKGKCAVCGSSEKRLLKCGRCMEVSYCGKECQAVGWAEGHKKECKVLRDVTWFTQKDWSHRNVYWTV